jgi:acetyl esterase/lipase
MRTLARLLSYGSALLGTLTLVRIQSPWQAILLWVPKLLASACSPFLALEGTLGALLSVLARDPRAAVAGLVGAVLSMRHVAQVTAPHTGFEEALGPDWQARIPPERRTGMLRSRYDPLHPAPAGVLWDRDVVVGLHQETGDPLLADLWQPPAGVRRSGLAVIYLHGSGWHLQDKDQLTRPFFRHLAGQGHVVVDVAYTLAPQAHVHAMLADVKRAIAWVKAHAGGLGIDPERVVLVGGSAGGHLALLAAYTPNHPDLDPDDVGSDTSVRAVASYYGVTDLAAVHDALTSRYGDLLTGQTPWERRLIARLEPALRWLGALPSHGSLVSPAQMVPGLLGAEPDEVPELCAEGSPICHVGAHCPPTLLLQGAHDLGVLPETVRPLHQALQAAGVPSVYVEYPETDHGFDLVCPRWSPSARAATYDLERFLALMA